MENVGWQTSSRFAINLHRSVLGRSDRYNYVLMCLCSSQHQLLVYWRHIAQQPTMRGGGHHLFPHLVRTGNCIFFFLSCKQLFHSKMLSKPQTRVFITFGKSHSSCSMGTSIWRWFFFLFFFSTALAQLDSNNWNNEIRIENWYFPTENGFPHGTLSVQAFPFENCAQMVCDKCTFSAQPHLLPLLALLPFIWWMHATEHRMQQDEIPHIATCCTPLQRCALCVLRLVFVRSLRAASANEC